MNDRQRPDNFNRKELLPSRNVVLLPLVLVLIVVLLLAVVIYNVISSESDVAREQYRRLLMDTDVELDLVAASKEEADRLKDQVFGEMERLEALFSRSLDGSEVDRINRQAGRAPVKVEPEVITVLKSALHFAEVSGGAFDPTIAPLLDRWGFLEHEYRLPDRPELAEAMELVDYTLLELDAAGGTVYLPEAGMSLDLGGIAKGYVVDRGLAVLEQAGVEHAFLNAGGDIGLIGARPDGTAWRIGVRHPREHNRLLAVIPLIDGAVVTSGDYQRVFEKDGRHYHHILDPKTGFPADTLTSVTITAPTVMEADALSTAVFVMGPEKGLALVENLPGVEAILVTPELEVIISSGLQGIVELK